MPASSIFRIYDSIPPNPAPPTITGTLSATDAADTASFTGAVNTTGTFTKTETSADTASFTGSVGFPTITGTLSGTAPLDTASMTGTVATPSSSGATSRAWLPTDAAGAYSWLKAKSSADYTLSGSTVTAIVDKTGKSHGASQGTRNGIGFSSTGLDGSQPAFTFNGSAQSIDLAVPANMPNVAYCFIGNFASGYMSIFGCENTADLYSVGINGSDQVFLDLFGDTNISQGGSVTRSTPQIIVVTRNGFTGDYQIRLNGTSVASGGYSHSLASASNHILGGVYNRDYVTGAIGEVLILDAYDPTTLQKVEGYFAADWGVQSILPSGHPYKSAAPVATEGTTWARTSSSDTVAIPDANQQRLNNFDGGNSTVGRFSVDAIVGRRYFEIDAGVVNGTDLIGLTDPADPNFSYSAYNGPGRNGPNSIAWFSYGGVNVQWDGRGNMPGWSTGDRLRWAVDETARLLWVAINGGSWNNNGTADPASGVGGIAIPSGLRLFLHNKFDNGNADAYIVLKSQSTEWTYAAPAGFTAINAATAATAALWSPNDLTSAKKVGWFDAQDAATITQSGGLVSAWANKFGATLMSNLTQATGTLQPAYSATGFNASYGGVASIAKAMNATITGLTDELTAIVIGKFEGTGNGRFISVGLPGNADWDYGGALLEIINDGGYKFHPYGQYTDFGYVGAQGTSPQSWAAQFKNGASKFRVNGLQPGATNTSAFGFGDPARFAIGDDVQGDRTDCNITYAEIILLRGATDDDIARVEGYAMWKRGLQGTLDAAHPYKSAAPTVAGGGTTTITGTLTATESSADTAGITGSVKTSGTLSATDAGDTATITGGVKTSGTLSATDSVDTASITGSANYPTITGSLSATDPSDASSATGSVNTGGTLAATDSIDTSSISGSVAWPPITGTFTKTETSTDTASATGGVTTFGTLSASDPADSLSFNDGGAIYGNMSPADAQDTAAFTGNVITTGTLAGTDLVDGASISGNVKTSGTLAATETTSDTASFTGAITTGVVGVLVATDTGDVASITGSIKTTGVLAAVEAPDGLVFVGTVGIGGTLNATENAADTASATGSVYHKAVLAAVETTQDSAAFVADLRISGPLAGVEAKDVMVIIAKVFLPFTPVSEAGDTWVAQTHATDTWTVQNDPPDSWSPSP